MAEIVKATADQRGCWIDGHWGQYAVTRMIEIAEAHGYQLSESDKVAVETYKQPHAGPGTHQYVADLSDECEKWLDYHVAPKHYYFEWVDGEFFLSPALCDGMSVTVTDDDGDKFEGKLEIKTFDFDEFSVRTSTGELTGPWKEHQLEPKDGVSDTTLDTVDSSWADW